MPSCCEVQTVAMPVRSSMVTAAVSTDRLDVLTQDLRSIRQRLLAVDRDIKAAFGRIEDHVVQE